MTVSAHSSVRRPIARLDDGITGRSLSFVDAVEIVTAREPSEVLPALDTIQDATARGLWAVGSVAYEAATAFDPATPPMTLPEDAPLVCFALCREALHDDPWPEDLGPFDASEFHLDVGRPAWRERVARVQDAIRRGDSYQVNLTARMHGRITGDLLAAHRALTAAQHGAYGAFLDIGPRTILSASPERFVTWRDGKLTATPMKGTARRDPDPTADAALRHALLTSAKERAENVMIVDLLRNDLSRVCLPGSVRVPALLACETYPTVHQLTSTITGTPRRSLRLVEMLAALFPCGSITGAPKLSTMEIIGRLEDSPRGVYCGTIGVIAPGPTMDASFSVPIRTITVDPTDGAAVYGVGAGITWDSDADAELDELRVKARVLSALTSGARP